MVEAVVLRLQEVLAEVQVISNSSSREEVDRILLSLSCSSAALGELLNSIVIRQELSVQPESEVAAQLRELHWCTDKVLLEWECRLHYSVTMSSGKSKKPINIPMVEMMREQGYTWEQIANTLMVSRVTIWRRLREVGMQCSRYTKLTDPELDSVVSDLVRRFPLNGIVMMWGHLRSLNIFVTRDRVHDSLLRTSSELVETRQRCTLNRRVYSVPAPNCLWHIDGLHRLIRWRIVVHGGIDGFSRRVVYLHASDNNRADTVGNLFRAAVSQCGWPSRVRSDKGGENIEVARLMVSVRGTGRRSHLVGSSVHNQRVERLWRDTFRCACRFFYFLFYEMEDMGILDPDRDADLFALHYVFLPRINVQLLQFKEAWNCHPMRTERGLCPIQLWQRGMLSASPRWQQEIIDGFNVPAEYGIQENEHFINNFDQPSVVVPRTGIQLTPQQIRQLEDSYSPFQYSNHGGADIYVNVRHHILDLIHA